MSETNYRESLCVSAVLSGVSVRLSVHSLLYKLVSKQLKAIFSAFCRLIVFFNSGVTRIQGYVTPQLGVMYSQGTEEICDFRLKSPFIPETVRDRPIVAMER